MKIQLLSLTFTFLVILSPVSVARTWYVIPDGTGSAPTIQAAIDSAAAEDTVALADGVYTGAGNRDLDYAGKAIVIRSYYEDPAACVIDCEGSSNEPHRGFNFHSGEGSGSVLEGVTIRNGYQTYGGAVYCASSSSAIRECRFVENEALDGGAVYCRTCAPVISHCWFIDNTVGRAGGGLRCYQANADVSWSIFYGNTAIHGGAAYINNYSATVLTNCTLCRNTANAGAGLFIGVNSSPVLQNTVIVFNLVACSIHCDLSSNVLTLNCCNFFGNDAGDYVWPFEDQYGVNGNISNNPQFCGLL
ncbi:MAG: hypothetical protein JSW58_16220, partial [Candidatus Latescibacterota bacterium]